MERITGRMVRQLEGYSAFMPEDLPPHESIQFDDEMQGLLSRADRALGRLDGSVQSLPDPDLFVFMYVVLRLSFSPAASIRLLFF